MTMLHPILIFLLFTGPASSLVTNTSESKFTIKETDEEKALAQTDDMCRKLLANTVIENYFIEID